MREIKFRAWDGKAMYNVLRLGLQGYKHLLDGKIDDDSQAYKTDQCIVMQYTNIQDKNGVDIYEGDILLFDISYGTYGIMAGIPSECRHTTTVIRNTAGFEFFNGLSTYERFRIQECQVTGNIYQNPELGI